MTDFLLKTGNFNTVTAICSEAMEKSKFISVVGYPGAGKTTALLNFSENKPNVYYTKATTSKNAMDFFKELLHEISYEDKFQGANLYQLITIISKRLNMDSTKKLLIVDEAGKFRPKYLEYFHEIRDNTESSTGIIFAGPEYFKENIMEWKNKGTRGIPELYRRINHWEVLDFPAKKEIEAFCRTSKINDKEFEKELFRSAENFSDIINRIDEYHRTNN